MLTCEQYISPGSLDEALAAVADSAGPFRFVAGATDLLPWAREGRAGDVHIPLMVDLGGLSELRGVRRAADRVWIGAMTPFQRFLDDAELAAAVPGMPDCAVWFADDQIRETATLGGNIINASPAADSIPPLLGANASVELAAMRNGQIRRRTVALRDFIAGPGRTAAEDAEILLGVECDVLTGYGGAFEKVGHRRSLVISVACLSAVAAVDATGRRFRDLRLAIGGVGPVARRMDDIERELTGVPLTADAIRAAMQACDGYVQSRTRQEYRKEVAAGFLARALARAARRAGVHDDVCTMMEEIAHG